MWQRIEFACWSDNYRGERPQRRGEQQGEHRVQQWRRRQRDEWRTCLFLIAKEGVLWVVLCFFEPKNVGLRDIIPSRATRLTAGASVHWKIQFLARSYRMHIALKHLSAIHHIEYIDQYKIKNSKCYHLCWDKDLGQPAKIRAHVEKPGSPWPWKSSSVSNIVHLSIELAIIVNVSFSGVDI